MCIYVPFSGTEELAHLEIVAAILHQLTRDLSIEEIQKSGFDKYFVDHTVGVYPIAASGVPFDMKYIGVKGDPITDLHEDMGAEQKARTTYDNLLRLIDDPEVCDPIKFLREREIVHYQRFGEANLPNYTDFAPALKRKKADPKLSFVPVSAFSIVCIPLLYDPYHFYGSVFIYVYLINQQYCYRFLFIIGCVFPFG